MIKTYPAKQDIRMILSTIFGGFVPIVVLIYLIFYADDLATSILLAIFTAIYAGLLIWAYIHKPKKFVLTNDKIIIERIARDIDIPLSEIISAGPFADEDRKSFLRSYAINGLFGILNKIRTKKSRQVAMYITRYSDWVLISTNVRYYVISPATDEFIKDVNLQKRKFIRP